MRNKDKNDTKLLIRNHANMMAVEGNIQLVKEKLLI